MGVNLPQKAAIYIRVSTQFQIDKDSLQVQRRELAAYSELVLHITDYVVFEDPGYSGKNTDRPAYKAMVERLRTGEFSHLLVWKIDRISRNLLDFASMYAELKRLGVVFVSQNEQFDTSTAIGEAMLKIILVFAELERQMTAERVTAVMLSRANNGQWNGGRVPYGYDYDPKTKAFSVNNAESAVYQRIVELYEDRQSLQAVCKILNSEGVFTRAGNPWSPVTIRTLLTNVWYEGIYRYNVHSDGKGSEKRQSSEWVNVDGHHDPLIDDVRFDRLQYLLTRNRRTVPKMPGQTRTKSVHIFAGLLICGNCGRNMTASQDRRRADGWRPSAYGCSARRKKTGPCSNKFVNDVTVAPFVFAVLSKILDANEKAPRGYGAEWLERHILSARELQAVKRISGLPPLLESLKNGASGMEYSPEPSSVSEQENEAESLKITIRKNETALQRLQSLYLYGTDAMPEKDYLLERKRIMGDIAAAESRLMELGENQQQYSETEFANKASYFIMVENLLHYKPGETEKVLRSLEPSVPKAFFAHVIERIVVTDGKITEMRFRSGISIRFIYG